MASGAEVAAMRRAVELSTRGLGTTRPNPVVGCVVLGPDGRTTVGEGWHQRAGGPHAEVAALAGAGARARGGTALVTLEPCAHHGRTPPCTDALLAAGVRRVVVAVRDPHPPAAGGVEVLRAAGVDVEVGVLAAEAGAANQRWLAVQRRGRPYVTWKFAASLDGRVAAADGTSRWITSRAARLDAHRLRAEADAVVVGVGTVLADDPQLTVRHVEPTAQPLRVVVDTRGRTPRGARVLDEAAPTLLAVGRGVVPPPGADTVVLPPGEGGLDLAALLAALHARDCQEVLVEGGPTLAGSFVDAGLVDRVVGYLAPALLGGPPAYPALRGRGAAGIAAAVRLTLQEVTPVGPDLRLTARLDPPDGED
ncbi:MAG TPA: bifunctional diaminohydroxyphosphoribosylaminopyrimidine deaminase/5-amino-6-(5-phosphoribosylamino)uracil reductase RibD [Frankiaceae bacterium]|nr:bifunctional diaminohydroxyphosphoribosylaminopyrimidine deaminase/5-amino-6-(5-phosphoribosylamino)uracil reductase RibD [Frankiaceae bacterium]